MAKTEKMINMNKRSREIKKDEANRSAGPDWAKGLRGYGGLTPVFFPKHKKKK